jgi:serine/threonine protein kinase
MDEDVRVLIDLLDAEGREDISEIFEDATSELNVGEQYGSRLFSLISHFVIYLPPADYVKAKKINANDRELIKDLVCGIYPLRDHEPEVVSVEFSVQRNYSRTKNISSEPLSNKREQYSIKKLIGSGGFGEVYEAVDFDGVVYAIKFLKKDHDENDLKRFKREVKIQSNLKHKNIVPILDMDLETPVPWFVMPKAYFNFEEYLEKRHGEKEVPIFLKIAEGIAFAHSNGIIHRDIKPLNVLMFPNEKTKALYPAISDFGLGRFIDRDSPPLTISNLPIGTFEYVAPEQMKDAKTANESADIYSLGKLLYQTLSGKSPYPTLEFELIPKKYFYTISKAANDNPERRYRSVDEFLQDVELVFNGSFEFEKSSESILKVAIELNDNGGASTGDIESFAKSLLDITENSEAMIEVFPKIPDLILKSIVEKQPAFFKQYLKSYDSYIDEVGFGYCDVIAKLYRKIFSWTNDRDIHCLILRRLPILAKTHNRWYVGEVFAGLVRDLTEESLILFTRDVLKENPSVREWCGQCLSGVNLPKIIRNLYPKT